jgi:hypothetical protein
MTDRELLEKAAKAVGIKALIDPLGRWRDCTSLDPAANIFAAPLWNPLTDDGDTLRLAVKLGFDLRFFSTHIEVWKPGMLGFFEEIFNADPCAATRRAIVRAAAAALGDSK